jgi:hypothetical protein
MAGESPFQIDRAAFDEMLERLEDAQRNQRGYGPVENAADVEIAKVFVERWWDLLSNAEQTRYQARLKYLKFLGKGIR